MQRDVPTLTASLDHKKPLSKKPAIGGGDTFRGTVLNKSKKSPLSLGHIDHMTMN
jgi:hypothetical protein